MHGCDSMHEFVLSITSHAYTHFVHYSLNHLSVRGDEGRRDNDDKRPIRTLSSCRQKMPGQFITFVRGTFVSCWVNKQNILPIVDFRSAVKLPYDHRSVANKVLWNRRGRRQHTGFPSQTTLITISARGGRVSGRYICSLRTESLHSPKPYIYMYGHSNYIFSVSVLQITFPCIYKYSYNHDLIM